MNERCSVTITGLLFVLIFYAWGWAGEPDTTNPLAQYVAGLEMLEQARGLDVEQKTRLFRELEQVTGLQAHQATKLLNTYVDRPDKWKEIQQAVIAILQTYTSPKPDTQSEKEHHDGK